MKQQLKGFHTKVASRLKLYSSYRSWSWAHIYDDKTTCLGVA